MRSAMCSRRVARLALVGLLVVTSAPHANAARRCELLKDQKGDAGLNGGEGGIGPIVPGTEDESLDIVSADIATDARRLTVVIRVARLSPPSALQLYRERWSFHFATPETAFFLSADRTDAASSFTLNHYTTEYSGDTSRSYLFEYVGEVTGVVDLAASEIRMTAPLSMFKPYDAITTGVTLHKLLVITWLKHEPVEETGSFSSEADETGGGGRATYRAGDRNCVAVGR